VLDTPTYKQVTDCKLVIFEEQTSTSTWDIGVVAVDGSSPPKDLLNTRFTERLGTLSPDGRFLAYMSAESGQPEVYVVNFPDADKKWPVSAGGEPSRGGGAMAASCFSYQDRTH
jgi:Tol biopolymer transport system component